MNNIKHILSSCEPRDEPLLIVNLLQFCVCSIGSCVTPSTQTVCDDALPRQYVPVRSHAVPRSHLCAASLQNLAVTTSVHFSVSLWNDLVDPVCDGVGLAGFKSRHNTFFIGLSCSISIIVFYYFSLSLLSVYIGWYCGAGVFGLIGCTSLSLSLALPTSFNNSYYNSNNNSSPNVGFLFPMTSLPFMTCP